LELAVYRRMASTVAAIRNSRHGLTVVELMKALECSRSTVERTLNILRDAEFDLQENCLPSDDHRVKRWKLTKEGFLSSPIAQQLLLLGLDERLALHQLYLTSDNPVVVDALGKILAFQDALPRAKSVDLEELVSRDLRVSSVGPKQRVDEQVIETLRAALIGGTCVMLGYQGGTERLVQPHGVIRARFHYLVARGEDENIRIFRLDLISSLRETDQIFSEPEGWDFPKWAHESFGVFHSDEPITVTLEFDIEVADRARRLVFHPTQRQKPQDDGSLLVQIRCKGHRELLHEILHPDWLGHVRVLGPAELLQELADFLRTTMQKNGIS